jgi:hypothetical protein
MKQFTFVHDNAEITVFYLDAGDKIGKHQHPHTHSTSTLQGETEVEIWYEEANPPEPHLCLRLRPDNHGMSLPAKYHHEIRAVADNTIVVNLRQKGPNEIRQSLGVQAPPGGIIFGEE